MICNNRLYPISAFALCLGLLPIGYITSAHALSDNEVATLYRSSSNIENARFHVASFDATERTFNGTTFDYNWSNCQIAAELFQNQSGVEVKYWCEKGRVRE